LLGGNFSHPAQRLPHGREPRSQVGRSLYVIKPDDGYIFRHAQAGVTERSHGADGRDIVEGNQGCEWPAYGE
jgi:hypothetical protein